MNVDHKPEKVKITEWLFTASNKLVGLPTNADQEETRHRGM